MECSKQRLFFIIFAFISGTIISEMAKYGVYSPIFHNNFTTDSGITIVERSKCPDVTSGMMRGKWKARPLSFEERNGIDAYLQKARPKVSRTFQRADGLCGNVPYRKSLYYLRALCNHKGPTPCCFNNVCMNKSTDECRCPECYDLRTRIHAEYATWEPVDSRCQVKNFTTADACDLLKGSEIIVAGDSTVRQLYTALLLVLSNNAFDGALLPGLPKGLGRVLTKYPGTLTAITLPNPGKKLRYVSAVEQEVHDSCAGWLTFTEKCWKNKLKYSGSYCNGTVSVRYIMLPIQNLTSLVHSVLNKPKTYMITTMHCLDITCGDEYETFYLPAINVIKDSNALWPKLIFAPWHKFGLMKIPLIAQKQWARVKQINDINAEKLGLHRIPIFDTFNLTDGVLSHDGTHFGIGLNMMKLQMFFNFFEELKRKRSW